MLNFLDLMTFKVGISYSKEDKGFACITIDSSNLKAYIVQGKHVLL